MIVVERPVRYHQSAAELFASLGAASTGDAVLLESADIQSKEGLKSIAILRGSVRITCQGNRVVAEALTPSGVGIVRRLAQQLPDYVDSSGASEVSGGDDAAVVAVFVFPDVSASVAVDEFERLRQTNTLEPLRLLQQDSGYEDPELPFLGGGFAFDFLESFEALPRVEQGTNFYPDYQFLNAEILLTVDHQSRTAFLRGVCIPEQRDVLAGDLDALVAQIEEELTGGDAAGVTAPIDAAGSSVQARASMSDAEFRDVVEQMQKYIYEGDIYQVVPARAFTMQCEDAFAAYKSLRALNPSPYMFYVRGEVDRKPYELFGASPESNLKFNATSRQVELYPIAGTRPRGADHELDIRAELELRTDAKEIAEHTMLVDLARNDLARVAVPATRQVADLLQVDRYSRVMHLVSRVVATLRPELDALDAYRACMNMGTLTGAPKLRATELLRQTEGKRRGSYGGAVGYLQGGGDMDTCIVIRSAFVADGVATVQAGAGVVRDSQPQSEADETLHKAFAVLNAIAQAQGSDVEVLR
ncbi:anthranilate synthase component 1 [Corynebacterium argentoratense]|uniref:anthranilate synthase component 1 n=1 Tax=Corynebacterium argentoratense TaxID=42817 RepID=UPI004041EADA